MCLKIKADSAQLELLREKVKDFPQNSGIYLMKSQVEKIIYVGKAKNLRARVKSYFNGWKDLTPKTKLLVSHIREIEYILTKTEVEAFLLEASLIKKHKPKYNIRLKDDRSFPYIRLSWADEFPRLYLSRKVKKDGSYYFGPYTSGSAVMGTMRFLNRTFQIRDCTDSVFQSRTRPCLSHQIGRCTAPCVKLIDQETYRDEVKGARDFLSGKNKLVLRNLEKKMKESAAGEKFEVAARLRDSIRAVESILEKQAVISGLQDRDQDIVGFFGDERGCLIETLHVRAGSVLGTRPHYFPLLDPQEEGGDQRDWLVSFLNQYYDENFIPDEILIPIELGSELTQLLEAVLFERSGRKVIVRMAVQAKALQLMDMANQNAQSHFEKHVSKSELKQQALVEMQEKLQLKELPNRIECFDISTFQGSETVASQVVFESGVPAKEHYRRYKMKTVKGQDDFASMAEVLRRRFQHDEMEMPNLIVVDGGKGQLNSAKAILKELNLTVPIVGLAKARTLGSFQDAEIESSEERFFLPGRQNPVTFRKNSEAYHILVGIRDEAHRFAITYHRKLREATSLESELDLVIGLGEKRKKALLKAFQTVDQLKLATAEEIAQIPLMNRVLAERVLLQLEELDEKTDPGVN